MAIVANPISADNTSKRLKASLGEGWEVTVDSFTTVVSFTGEVELIVLVFNSVDWFCGTPAPKAGAAIGLAEGVSVGRGVAVGVGVSVEVAVGVAE